MNEIFSITFLYTHQPSHKNIAPLSFLNQAVGRGVFILLVCPTGHSLFYNYFTTLHNI